MYHDQHLSGTPPQHSHLMDGDHGGFPPGSWSVPSVSAGGTVVRDPPTAPAPASGAQTPREARHKRSTRKKAYRAFRNALSDRDEDERERDRRNPEERRRRPIYLSTCQDMTLRSALFLYFWVIVIAIFSMLNSEWILPYGAVPNAVSEDMADLAIGPFTKNTCLLVTDCNVTTDGTDCRTLIKNDLNLSGILFIIGIVATFFAMWASVRVGLYSCLFWRFKKDKPNAWRRKKKYRRTPACLSLLAAVLFLVGNIIMLNAGSKKYNCPDALCDPSRCVYGAAFWFMWLVVGVCFVGALALFFMWRFPPKDFVEVWQPLEMEEERQRKEAELQEWADYNESLGEAAATMDKLVTIEVLTRENEHLQQQLQMYRGRPNWPPMPPRTSVPLVQSFRLDSPAGKIADMEEVEDLEVGGVEPDAAADEAEVEAPPPNAVAVKEAAMAPGREAALLKENSALAKKLKVVEDKWKQEAIMRKKLFNELQDMKGKIRVLCRCRPFKPEVEEGQVELVFPDECTLQVPSKNKEYLFDCVFPPDTRQDRVWQECKGLAQSALDGYNVCIFAYGQTGSGKTYTMQGEDTNPGITPRMAEQVFEVCSKIQDTHAITISCYMVELYLEELNDLLLVGNKRDAPKLEIKQDGNGMVTVKNITVRPAHNAAELMAIYLKGTKQRHIRSHAMNDASSRSHLVFCITLESTNTLTGKVTTGKLSLVDLAGSERLKKTRIDATGVEEATSINDSLFELGKVISDLSTESPNAYVNKRNSKLTMIMSDSLGGNAKTMLIVCVSPATFNLPETVNSLEFATRCKKVTNAAAKNEDSKQLAKLKQQHRLQVEELEAEVARLRALLNSK